jgi:GGDEF domain-containing protein
MTAETLLSAVEECAGKDAFVGHIGGDDFLLTCAPDEVVALCERIMADFDARIGEYYDQQDWARGYIEVPDRRGATRRCPPVSIALGVATSEKRDFVDHREIVAAATEMKTFLKEQHRTSAYAVDERTGGLKPPR